MPSTAHRALLISGSLRSGSTNTALLRTVAALAPADATAELFSGTAALPYFDPDLDRDPLPPPVQELRDAVHAADALLICTPEYAGALPGAFKNLLEWLIGDNDPRSISGKPVGWINVSTGPTGARDAHESLRIVLTYAGARIVLSDSITVPRSAIADGLVADASIVERLAGTFDRLLR
ncbi:NADPH-dependent FMN reductase [Jongsikchunia kroppenstedtii]|uniref:NADPH-dependent FMN reductase n=1 Tax=Jongsikchunia kroppenstedtii TaxID=1121721 RepID=UPI00037E2DAE|nr:NADPH-dependent FMN reductase [Jongsikchunia kroppenstedtii]